jgi:alkylation response protein AidB-like acyl-CoA dehydrogenase
VLPAVEARMRGPARIYFASTPEDTHYGGQYLVYPSLSMIFSGCSTEYDGSVSSFRYVYGELRSEAILGRITMDRIFYVDRDNSKGIVRRPFWKNPILLGTQSDEVQFDSVYVPHDYVMEVAERGQLSEAVVSAMTNFTLMASSSYLGVASGLLERVLARKSREFGEQMRLVADLETMAAALERVALLCMDGGDGTDVFAKSLLVRYSTQASIARVTDAALEMLGGMSFVGGPEASYFMAASRALAFHPPSEISMRQHLMEYTAGKPLTLP